jgi:ABC-2 type transport system ATP-binding protein
LLSEVELTCDEVAILRAGRVIRQGTVAEIAAPSSSVILELETVTPAALEAAARIGTLQTPLQNQKTITVTLASEDRTPDLIAALVASGARIRAVTPIRESLEDIFVRVMEE